ncbi:hypothetical protein [Haloarchaeobius salinus]|uniref:hypothetical protein n=1 Tax=Haloarchaeobius salinus TaxID=1198298 RepID=UPI00210ECBE8|nr:hypothetical protein [Haloarchaeobius salinus]
MEFDALGRYGGSTRDSAVFESNVGLYSNGEWTPVEYTGVEGLSVSVSGEDGLETHLGRGSIYVGDDLVVETTELPDGRQVTIVGTERQLGDGEIVNHALSRLSYQSDGEPHNGV